MKLFHYTGREYHWPKIRTTKYLKTTESNLSLKQEHYGPDVVWLTSLTKPVGIGVYESQTIGGWQCVDKTKIRITVDIEDFHHWPTWSKKHGISRKDYLALRGSRERWYVVERPIYDNEWLIVEDVETGEILWSRETDICVRDKAFCQCA